MPSDSASLDLVIRRAAEAFCGHQGKRFCIRGTGAAIGESGLKYLSFLSHDLNNNLGAIAIHLNLLKQRLNGSAAFCEELSALESAQESIHHTTQGMRQMLTYARLRNSGGDRPNLRSVNLRQLVEGVFAQFAAVAREKGIELSPEVPRDAAVQTDGSLLVLILQNLVGNAVKYSRGGTVSVRGKYVCGVRDDRWLLSVSDQGGGIPSRQLKDIFGAFRRGEGNGETGVGLGLAIASEAAELLGADLSVESREGEGSTFSVELPRQRQRPTPSATPVQVPCP